jgi:hypothetical protein
MKIIDGKGRLFGLINIFDLVIILLVISFALGVYVVFLRDDGRSAGEKVTVEYELLLEEPRKALYIDAFVPGEKVYFKESDILIGTIRDIKSEEAWEYGADINGNWVRNKTDGFYDITLVVEAEAAKAENGYIIHDNWNAFTGTSVEFSTRRYTTIGMVTSLEEK